MSQTKEDLIPPDPNQCQAEIPNGVNAFTLGGRSVYTRCKNKPLFIVTETIPDLDGICGAMSMCAECLVAASKQLDLGNYLLENING